MYQTKIKIKIKNVFKFYTKEAVSSWKQPFILPHAPNFKCDF